VTRRPKFPVPASQRVCLNGWVLARQPQIGYAYRLLFRGQHVGWLIVEPDGWRYRTPRPNRSFAAEVTSKAVFPSWERAAAAAARSGWARRIAGAVLVPGNWQRAPGLRPGREPWTPRPDRAPAEATS
jgi:hypothetical protein